jgi:hypothetical protein
MKPEKEMRNPLVYFFLQILLCFCSLSIHLNNMKTNQLKKLALAILAITALILVSSCAESENVKDCLTGSTYGFLGGLWHGIIAPIDFIAMLFRNNVTLYAQNNNGAWYAFGFLLGSGGWGFLGGKGLGRSRRNSGN